MTMKISFHSEAAVAPTGRKRHAPFRPSGITSRHFPYSFRRHSAGHELPTGCRQWKEGFHWLEEILRLDAKAVVIFITAYADTEKAVQAIKQGATDFIPKPWQNEKLLATVSSALQLSFSRTEVEALKKQKEKLKNSRRP